MRLFSLSPHAARIALSAIILQALLQLQPVSFAAASADETPATAAEAPDRTAESGTPASAPQAGNEALDALFAQLRRESDGAAARQIARQIAVHWNDSQSATGNLLMQWATEAIARQNAGLALDFLDQVTVLFPEFAEGWNRRATLHFMNGDLRRSMADINRVLSLEPRHYGALAGLAAILERTDRDALALEAWKKILAIYPANRAAQSRVVELEDKLTGRRI
ncbi:hypothetical protein KY465_11265 [Pseudohoeflea sp. DP4N28-3]|uniref:Tetratricopeptide repeat protein n=2 Tax=Pseudohoeflea coraliihabitans TaxID=2860393 RepID=A0ABS6WPH8_9HYPH|nr:hypothetical protein [Pseudohoeflea sp. DP4N28-3]